MLRAKDNDKTLQKMAMITQGATIVCISINPPPPPPPSKTPPHLFLAKPPLKFENCLSPPFLGNPPTSILVFCEPPPPHPNNQIFQWTPKIPKFFIFNPILSFKSNYILS